MTTPSAWNTETLEPPSTPATLTMMLTHQSGSSIETTASDSGPAFSIADLAGVGATDSAVVGTFLNTLD
ncbi:hypothetical protein [Arthrobacter glacialis]|uniref:hypothetical protein n=1 Tax=Arthrobacter glacialis TaxID=1664 RepID=UPI001FB0217E|nr:hypothetical protein [Arthrobacter glacialis]